MKRKLTFALLGVALALLLLVFALIQIRENDEQTYARIVLSQQSYDSRTIAAQRGNITDRNGTILATNEAFYILILDPNVILADEDYTKPTIDLLVEVYDFDRTDLENRINQNPNSHYIRYKTGLTREEMDAFIERQTEINQNDKLDDEIRGVWFETSYRRVYPYESLGCTFLGFATANSGGSYGLEQYYEEELSGVNGRVYGYLNDDSNVEVQTVEAQDGYTIVSTVDATVQNIIETHIAKFMKDEGATEVAVLCMDPRNGEVLGMATSKVYDPNKPMDISAYYDMDALEDLSTDERYKAYASVWGNYIIRENIEPGSTSKIMTLIAGLEEGLVDKTEHFYCDGGESFPGNVYVGCHLLSGHGVVSTSQAIWYSCNDAMMQISYRLGPKTFADYQLLFNLGMRTGIDLPGEERGLTVEADNMTTLTLATNAFGQNYNCTMVQMAAAYCSAINGGYYYEPHMVKQILDPDGNVVKSIDKNLLRKTCSETTSEYIRQILFETVEGGTATRVHINGYAIGGKTGTAEKVKRDKENYVLSFIGMAPVDNPEVLMYVVVDEPHEDDQSSSPSATQLFRDIAVDLFPYLNIKGSAETDTTPNPAWALPEDYPIPTPDVPDVTVPAEGQDPNATETGEGSQTHGSFNESMSGWSMPENGGLPPEPEGE